MVFVWKSEVLAHKLERLWTMDCWIDVRSRVGLLLNRVGQKSKATSEGKDVCPKALKAKHSVNSKLCQIKVLREAVKIIPCQKYQDGGVVLHNFSSMGAL